MEPPPLSSAVRTGEIIAAALDHAFGQLPRSALERHVIRWLRRPSIGRHHRSNQLSSSSMAAAEAAQCFGPNEASKASSPVQSGASKSFTISMVGGHKSVDVCVQPGDYGAQPASR